MLNDAAVLILAAGQGTRMKSRMAKVLHRAGRQDAGAARHRRRPEDRAAGTRLRRRWSPGRTGRAEAQAAGVGTIHQTEQLGTGHAVMCGEEQLAKLGGRLDCSCTAIARSSAPRRSRRWRRRSALRCRGRALTTDVDDPTGYGRIHPRPRWRRHARSSSTRSARPNSSPCGKSTRASIASKPPPSGITSTRSARITPPREYYLTDMIAILIRAGQRVAALKIDDPSELLGINNRVELAAADRILRAAQGPPADARRRHHREAGDRHDGYGREDRHRYHRRSVRARSPGETVIGENCRIGAAPSCTIPCWETRSRCFRSRSISASRLDSAGARRTLRPSAHGRASGRRRARG